MVLVVTVKTGPNSQAQGKLIAGETVTLYGHKEGIEGFKFRTYRMWADDLIVTVPRDWIKELSDGGEN